MLIFEFRLTNHELRVSGTPCTKRYNFSSHEEGERKTLQRSTLTYLKGAGRSNFEFLYWIGIPFNYIFLLNTFSPQDRWLNFWGIEFFFLKEKSIVLKVSLEK